MLAIHNAITVAETISTVANAFAKLSKCQQFTTAPSISLPSCSLQTLLQSYQNVSNSQLGTYAFYYSNCCKRFCKVIKMLAIHNLPAFAIIFLLVANAFAKLSKCQQFTTLYVCQMIYSKLQTLLQSYQNVSNSQLLYYIEKIAYCCKRFCKVIKMLAIHNCQDMKQKSP